MSLVPNFVKMMCGLIKYENIWIWYPFTNTVREKFPITALFDLPDFLFAKSFQYHFISKL